jgi:hypothetical protein
MPHDDTQTRDAFDSAKAELERIIDDFNSTPDEAAAATASLTQLGMSFAAANLAKFEARTQFLLELSAGLQNVIDSSQENPIGTTLDDVTGNVEVLADIGKSVKELLKE